MLAIGTVLQSRYRIVDHLGLGGMGAVYKAVDERLNKNVAIKEIVFDLGTTNDENQRNLLQNAFQREANSLVKARHRAVPDISDFFFESERRYLVMEYVGGDDLAKMLEKRGAPFSIEEVSPWIDQLLEALEYLHNLTPPILHRDVKPQNLKLDQWQRIKLLDFGIARSTEKDSTISQYSFLAATLNYAPIEQVLRAITPVFREFVLLKHRDRAEKFLEQDTDARCDIFGVGATFYHLLTNQIPADVTERALGIWEKGVDQLIYPSELNPEIPPGVSQWLLKAMAFERANRFASAGEMKQALRKINADVRERFSTISVKEATQEEAFITRDQQVMQANTERLIEPKNTEGEISYPAEYPAVTDPAALIGATEQLTPGEFAASTDFNTNPSVQPTSVNLIHQSFTDEERPTEQPGIPDYIAAPPQTNAAASNRRNYIPVLAVLGILLFAVSGVGLYGVASWVFYPPTIPDNTPPENINVSGSPDPVPTVEETGVIADGGVETNTETNINTAGKEPKKTPITATQPTAEPTVKIVVVKTPTIIPTPQPTVRITPQPPDPSRYVLCLIKSPNGTITKVRKKDCSECPPRTACEYDRF